MARRKTPRYAFIFALLFALSAIAQYLFFRHQIYAKTASELSAWADDVVKQVAYDGGWNLEGFRRAPIMAPSWYIISSNGLVIDIEGFIPGLIHSVTPFDDSVFQAPKTIVSDVGEKWELFGSKLDGGYVVVGIVNSEDKELADRKLRENAARFGSSFDEAKNTDPRQIDFIIDYAVVKDSGQLGIAWGGVPLKVDPGAVSLIMQANAPLAINGKSYLVVSKGIPDGASKTVGEVLVPKDITLEQNALREHFLFDIGIAALSFSVALLVAGYFIGREILERSRHVSLEEAREQMESGTVEFKPALQWDFGQARQNKDLALFVLKSVAAFLNARGGTLFIGVKNDGRACGIEEDLSVFGGSRDKFELHLRDLIGSAIGAEFSSFVSNRFENDGEQCICIVEVSEAPRPAFVKWKGEVHFYVRDGNKTDKLDTKEAFLYIQSKKWDS